MLRSNLCDYSVAYTVGKEEITVKGDNNAININKKLIFKNKGPFRSSIAHSWKCRGSWYCYAHV